MRSYQRFLDANRTKLLGYFLLTAASVDSGVLGTPYPPSHLNDEQLALLKDELRKCMPLDSIITNLWDWDVHFEECVSDDWYFEAVFGDEANLDKSSEELAEFFLEKCEEFDIDYNQADDQFEFSAFVVAEAKKFIIGWRHGVVVRYAQPGAIRGAPQSAQP